MAEKRFPSLTDLSHELLCHILNYLPLQEILSISMLCKKLQAAVSMHLRLCKCIDFCEGKIYDYMPSSITDDHMHSLFKKCPHLEIVYGLHPRKVERRRLRKRSALTVPGIIEALSLCVYLKSVETSDLRLLEAIMQHLPQLKIIGHFQNRDGMFPPHASQRLKLLPYPRISSLHLTGVEVPELTAMPHLEHLHLQFVRFTKLQPFRAFLATQLKTFVMKHCMGPTMALRYLSLIIALSSSPFLNRLELVRVPLPGGLFQRAVEDSYRHGGFVNLRTLVISGCKGVFEADLGHLMIVASKNLEKVFIQPSLTRDSLFVSLSFAQCEFPKLKTIHLGFVDKLDFSGDWSNDALLSQGLAEVPDTPSSLTDSGMKVISQLFPNIKTMTVSNCPHLMAMDQWSPIDGEPSWKELIDLTLQRCHCLQLPSFALFLAFLPKIEVVILNDMFREPPKGCSHVGLSAGTGLGMSSAVVSNQDEHIAVQGHPQDLEMHPVDHLDNEDIMEREFMDIDNEDNPDQHFRILQQEFFDEENHVVPAAAVVVQPDPMDPDQDQDVAENQIRRELNEDYDPRLNGSGSSDSSSDYSSSSSSSGSTSSSEDDDNGPSGFKEVQKGAPQAAPTSDASSQCDNLVVPSETKSSQTGHHRPAEDCSHSKQCKKNCSRNFDPDQPSTSRGGNCLDCSCMPPECGRKFSAATSDKSISVRGEEGCSRKLDENKSIMEEQGMADLTSESRPPPDYISRYVEDAPGPKTRHRKRTLTQEAVNSWLPDDPTGPVEFKDSAQKRYKKCDPVGKKSTGADPVGAKSTSSDPVGAKSTCYRPGPKSTKSDWVAAKSTGYRPGPKSSKLAPVGNKSADLDDEISKSSTSGLVRVTRSATARRNGHLPPRTAAPMPQVARRRLCRKSEKGQSPVSLNEDKKPLVNESFEFVTEGTQATSADIRRSLRRQRNCSSRCKKRGNGSCGNSHRRNHNHISSREVFKKSKQKSNVEMFNKSTSTSDPLMEDDAVQTLRLVSETLISLTIISCGISDIVIDHCHSLMHIEVQACRILKIFQLHYCPSLKKLNISQCPKLSLDTIVPDVLSLIATRKLLVCFEPFVQNYHPAETEKAVFSRAPLDQSVILFHDYTSSANETVQATVKETLLQWMEVVQNLYYTPSFWLAKQKKKKIKSKETRNRYPYGHCFRRIHGVFTLPLSVDPTNTNWRYQILTNDHAFASTLETVPWVSGFPAPDPGEAYTEDTALLSMIKTEIHEKSLKMRKKITSFYIPLTENNSCNI